MKHLMIWTLLAVFAAGQGADRAEVQLQAAIKKEVFDGDLKGAIEQYKKLANNSNRSVAARALVRLGQCYENLGQADARKTYERLVREFADQTEQVEMARARLTALDTQPGVGLAERQVWSLPKEAVNSVLSSDGRWLATMEWEKEYNYRIVLHDLATNTDRTMATNLPLATGYLAVSPDAKRVVLNWRVDDQNTTELRVLQADGASRTLLRTKEKEYVVPDAWSPDGKSILARIKRGSAPWDLVLISVADGSIRVLKSGGGIGAPRSAPRFSPDGRYIVHAADRIGPDGKVIPAPDYRATLHLRTVDGSNEVPLVQGAPTERDWGPAWSVDGSRIVFSSDRSGAPAIWSVRVADGKPQGEPELMRQEAGDLSIMGFAQDGTLYCERNGSQTDIYQAEIDPATGLVVDQPGRINQTHIGRTTGPLAFSPDGKLLAFNTFDNSKRLLVLRSIETGKEQELTQSPAHIIGWFPDGQSLLAGSRQLSRVDIKTGTPHSLPQLKRAPLESSGLALSHDGKIVYYWVGDRTNDGLPDLHIIRHDVETGEEKDLYHTVTNVNSLGTITISPNDRLLAFTKGRINGNALEVLPVEGGEARELFTQSGFEVTWSKDSRYVFALGVWTDGKWQLLSVPVDGGQIRPTGLRTDTDMNGLDVHPDGRHIAFASGIDRTDIVAIKNLLAAHNTVR